MFVVASGSTLTFQWVPRVESCRRIDLISLINLIRFSCASSLVGGVTTPRIYSAGVPANDSYNPLCDEWVGGFASERNPSFVVSDFQSET